MQHSNFFDDAKKVLVGGVNSPVRSFSSVDGDPVFVKKGKGSRFVGENGQSYIDYVLSWGPLLFGHAHPEILSYIQSTISDGTSFGAPTLLETKLANLVISFFPSIEKIRFVNSGTEASMSAIRLARGYTGKSYIVKFEGCYHGHVSSLLVSAGSGALTHGQPDSLGVLKDEVSHTLLAEYNNSDQVEDLFRRYGDNIAGVIVEPVAGNMGVVLPKNGFLETLRTLTSKHNSCLIFDEVMTGFRAGIHGAQQVFEIKPDITILGKVIGGGLPCGAYGASKEIMSCISPEGGVYQAGTLSGNPVTMAAGIATLEKLKNEPTIFDSIEEKTKRLIDGLHTVMKKTNLPFKTHSVGTMFSLFFTDGVIENLSDVKKSQSIDFRKFYRRVLEKGVYLAPSPFEAGFMSSAHSVTDIEQTIDAIYYGVSDF
ncbi:glutamate-1-semialdehyde 2,1-aminomutase [bacterium]|jgi:glutamate-1-semialdehyde 2,1-aminomutase|nr:glutamate-1-semialdehyde 2,1-aminomutase [bacterium]